MIERSAWAVGSLCLVAACASPGKVSVVPTKTTALALASAPVVARADTTYETAVIRLRYPAVITEAALPKYIDTTVKNRLLYSDTELVKQRKFEASNRIDEAVSHRDSDARSVVLTATAKTTYFAGLLYENLEHQFPGHVVLEPLEVSLDAEGRLTTSSLERAALPPANILIDFVVYSHPQYESFAAKFIPLVTIRTGDSAAPNTLIASDPLLSAKAQNTNDLGFTFIDYLNADPAIVGLASEIGALETQPLMAGAPATPGGVYAYPLEFFDLTKAPFREALEGESGTDNPFATNFGSAVAIRAAELYPSTLEDTLASERQKNYEALFFGQRQDQIRSIIGAETASAVALEALKSEIQFLSSASERIRDLSVTSEYGTSVAQLFLEEVKHEQQQEVMQGVMLATALVGGGLMASARAAGGAAASQAVLNSLQVSVLAMASLVETADSNFTVSFGKLIEDQRVASQHVGVYGKTVVAETLPELRINLLKDVTEILEIDQTPPAY